MLSKLVLRIKRAFGGKCGEVSIDQAEGIVGKTGVFFFDVNSPRRYQQGHIPGARNIAPGKLDAGALPPDKNATLFSTVEDRCEWLVMRAPGVLSNLVTRTSL